MCLILLAHQIRGDLPLVLVANRDEFLDRPTAPLSFWTDNPNLLAGRDLRAGGTWLGAARGGRLAAVTNFREGGGYETSARSRGSLVTSFLDSPDSPEEYLANIAPDAHLYNGFNLLVWMRGRLGYFSNRSDDEDPQMLGSGLYGLSNHLIDTPWPKVVKGKRRLSRVLKEDNVDAEALLSLIYDLEIAPDADLPDTGMSLEKERALSSMFIRMEGYGTRSTSVVMANAEGRVDFYERTYNADGKTDSTKHMSIQGKSG